MYKRTRVSNYVHFTKGEGKMYDLQKASLLKRFSAFLLDFILITIVITGCAFLLSEITNYSSYYDTYNAKYAYYEEINGVDFDIDESLFNTLDEAEQKKITDAFDAFANDQDALYAYNMMFNLTLMITSLSIFFGYFIIEFIIPLIFKNGQTVGKKVFAIGVMQQNGVRLNNIALFSRSVLGKCTIETMVPVLIIATMLFGGAGIVGVIVLGLILVMEIVFFIKDKKFTFIHDVIGYTVVVDLPSQMIFDSEAELVAYKAKLHAAEAERNEY